MNTFILLLFVFSFGAIVGSFLNVVIYRLPLNESVVTPRSTCPKCKSLISWYDNIPIFSYIFLKGSCRKCNTKIHLRYPFVELIMGLIAVYLFPVGLGDTALLYFGAYFGICALLLAHFFIDLDHKLLLDKLNIYLLMIILPFSVLTNPPITWISGAALGLGVPYFITWAFYKIKGQIGLGGGDIKLFCILGFLFGPKDIMLTIFVSSLLGSIIGVVLLASKRMNRNDSLAFGPYIIFVAFVRILYPEFFSQLSKWLINN